jgi:hypothetical protein
LTGRSPRVEIPTVEAVHALASVAAEHTKVWWRELQILLVAHSGLCWASTSLHRQPARCRRLPHQRRPPDRRHAICGGLRAMYETDPRSGLRHAGVGRRQSQRVLATPPNL